MLRFPFVLVRNLLALLRFLWAMFWYKVGYFFRRKKKLYLSLDLDGDYPFGPRSGLAGYFQEKLSFLELRDGFQRAGRSGDIDGIVITSNGLSKGMARTGALTSVVDRARQKGLHIVAHSRMPMLNEYILLTAADDILLSPSATLYTFGPRFDQFFAAEALERLGVHAQMVHIGEFKTASHRFIHREMTQPQRLMMQSLHDGLVEILTRRVALRRGLEAEETGQLFADAPIDVAEARRKGLADHGLFRGRIAPWLRRGDEVSPSAVPAQILPPGEGADASEPEETQTAETGETGEDEAEDRDEVLMVNFEDAQGAMRPRLNWTPLFGEVPQIAVLDLSGMIVMPDMGLPTQGPVIDPDQVLPRLKQIRQSPRYAGLMLHINSPGGSALASDVIWEAIQRVRREIPVAAYCTDVVGSGGYYLASAADTIVCHRTTLAGSIGVVTGKVSAEGLPERFGMNVESIYDHDADTFTSPLHPLSEKMLDRMNDGARAFYRRFLQRVGQARHLPRRRLHRYARGRVYLGQGAARRDLVDEIGDFDIAFDRLCELARLEPGSTDVEFVEHRQQGLRQMFQGGLQTLVPDQFQPASTLPDELVEPMIAAKLLQREPVLALMPTRVNWSDTSGQP